MKVVNFVKTAVWIAFLTGVSAAGLKYVAVVETDVDAASGAAAYINPAEIREITAELRRQATINLPPGKYSVMTSETVQSMGGAVLEECSEENCVITLGSRIGAEYIVRGTISKFQTRLTLAIELYETNNGTLVISSEAVRAQNLEELLDKAAVACANMYKSFAAAQGYAGKPGVQNLQEVLQSQDFSAGRRLGTWALNMVSFPLLPSGLGSFTLMKDYVGGSIMLGTSAVATVALFADEKGGLILCAVVLAIGNNIFNIVRSASYHKPQERVSATAADFKPYDGLKFAVVPTESGDFKVLARYDYSF